MLRAKYYSSWSILLALLIAFGLMVVGCEEEGVDEGDFGPPITVDYLIDQGWDAIASGDADAAITNFSNAANADAANLISYLGLGYAYAMDNQPNLALSSFGNVLALGPVVGDLADDAPIYAETYAGMCASYLAQDDYTDAITYALLAEAIWEDADVQYNRYLTSFGLSDVKVIRAESYYGLEEYGLALDLVEEISSGFIAATAEIVEVEAERSAVAVLEATHTDGIALVVLGNDNLIDVYDASIDGNDCSIVSYIVSTDSLYIQGNPIPVAGDSVDVDYLYATDYGLFLIALRDKLSELSQ